MTLTLHHGHSEAAGTALAAYGLVLSVFNNTDGACRFGKLALQVLNRRRGDDDLIALMMIGNFLMHWKHATRDQLQLFDRAYESAIEGGEPKIAAGCRYTQLQIAFFTGTQLNEIIDKSLPIKQMADHSLLVLSSVMLQMIENLMVPRSCPTVLTGQYIDEKELNRECVEANNELALIALTQGKILVAHFFQDWSLVIKPFEKARRLMKQNRVAFSCAMTMMHAGIAYAINSRKNRRFNQQIKARKILKTLKIFAKSVGTTTQLHTQK